MTGRHWIRKDVLLPILYALGLGALLYWLWLQLQKAPAMLESSYLQLVLWLILALYLLLALITIRHILSTYDLERYDPGEPASLKRLMRRFRYRLRHRIYPDEALLVAIEQSLLDKHYLLESESHQIGRIYRRNQPGSFFRKQISDRVIILQHEPLNVLLIDQLLQDCIRHIRSQSEKPSRRNILILVTRMNDTAEVASSAAGIVNFLGKFKGGTLCPMLLATHQHRLFYPADRTLLPRAHRFFQNRLRWRLKRVLARLPNE